MNLTDYELRVRAAYDAADEPIIRAATLLRVAAAITGAVWAPWAEPIARQIADHARMLADELVGGGAEEKVLLWATRSPAHACTLAAEAAASALDAARASADAASRALFGADGSGDGSGPPEIIAAYDAARDSLEAARAAWQAARDACEEIGAPKPDGRDLGGLLVRDLRG